MEGPCICALFARLISRIFFSQQILFFSHNKSVNSTFSHDLSAKRIGQLFINLQKGREKTEHGGCKVVEEHGALAFVPERPIPSPLSPHRSPAYKYHPS